ncbi:hypothetical protein [Niabella soli]|uniref:Uncharacterized protein n=1 Tax=Niabella soli DSM 19437 TaxID=929713 RepID=W0F044_9BACT|nr:hypothetical protein [Niabella soli]AHF14701.1 hypothetical protein NIASO_04855 [Niabella soli DSM 19437]
MTKIMLSIVFALTIMQQSFAQVDKKQSDGQLTQKSNAVAYRLFPTQNMWTFIKLNTRNGQMWQVQFDVKEKNRSVTNLSTETLITTDKETNDRFTLYSTQNIFTFILLDQLDGRTWQVQWSMKEENRGMISIH